MAGSVARAGRHCGPSLRALSGQTVEMWGDGDNVRDYLYIEDAVLGLMELAKYGESGEVYNVSSGIGTSVTNDHR